MKKKNLDRYETVASNLQQRAEQEKRDYLEKLKKRKKQMQTVETMYKNERSLESEK